MPMKSVVIGPETTDEKLEELEKKMDAEGWRLGMASDCGVPLGHVRLTFMPKEIFTDAARTRRNETNKRAAIRPVRKTEEGA